MGLYDFIEDAVNGSGGREGSGPEEIKAETEDFYYTVQSGDTLSKIAKEQYGDARKYMKIFDANRDILKDPNLIYPGQMLKIP